MSLNAIIGSEGFIGSSLIRYTKLFTNSTWIGITRNNYQHAKFEKYDTIIWAAGLSSKPKCYAQPEECLKQNVGNIKRALMEYEYNKFVYISSFDVYPLGRDYSEEEVPFKSKKLFDIHFNSTFAIFFNN
jgi:dTDP-4-dehydrorhamnose reductase